MADLGLLSGLVGSILALTGSLGAVAYQIFKDRTDRRQRDLDLIKAKRLSVISDLVAHRYVLTSENKKTQNGVASFNAALNRIPIEFIEFPDILDQYRSIGENFEAEKFHKLILSLIKVTTNQLHHLDYDLLAKAPSTSIPTWMMRDTNSE